MGDVTNLRHERARVSMAVDISVVDCLGAALEDARDGRWQKCVIVLYDGDEDKFRVDRRFAGCTTLEARGLLLSAIMNEFRDE